MPCAPAYDIARVNDHSYADLEGFSSDFDHDYAMAGDTSVTDTDTNAYSRASPVDANADTRSYRRATNRELTGIPTYSRASSHVIRGAVGADYDIAC